MERTLDPARLGDHLDRLYRAAWALCGSREDAEDLVQETYARVLARPRLLRNEDDLGYLLRALRNTFLNQKRTESRRLRPDPLPDAARPRRRPAGASSRRPRSRSASCTPRRRAPRRLPRRPRRRRRRRSLLQGGGTRAAHPRGHGHEPPLPRAPAGRAPLDGGRLTALSAGVDRPDEHLLARRGLIAVGTLARHGQRREILGETPAQSVTLRPFVERPDRHEHAGALRSHAS